MNFSIETIAKGRLVGKVLSKIVDDDSMTTSLSDYFISFRVEAVNQEKIVEKLSFHLEKEPSKILRIEQDSLIIYNMSPALQEVINDIVEMYKILE